MSKYIFIFLISLFIVYSEGPKIIGMVKENTLIEEKIIIQNSNLTEEDRETLELYFNNNDLSCSETHKSSKKVKIIVQKNIIYEGFLNDKMEPVGLWTSNNGLKSCYLEDKEIIIGKNSKVVYYKNEQISYYSENSNNKDRAFDYLYVWFPIQKAYEIKNNKIELKSIESVLLKPLISIKEILNENFENKIQIIELENN